MKSICLTALIIASAGVAFAQTGVNPGKEDMPEAEKIYSPYVERTVTDRNFAEGLFWGDTHLHTSSSADAGMLGNKLGPEDAYRFALGEEVITSTGQRARLIRPLDFLVVSDHAENLGLAPFIAESNPELLKTEYGKKWSDMVKAGNGYEAFLEWGMVGVAQNTDVINSPKMQRTIWDRQIEAAERFNDPGSFTAFIGFEWTSINNMENPSNLHRVIIFKDNADKATQVLPLLHFRLSRPREALGVIRNSHWKTSSPTTAPGTRRTLPASMRNRTGCCRTNTPAPRSRLDSSRNRSWVPTHSSSA